MRRDGRPAAAGAGRLARGSVRRAPAPPHLGGAGGLLVDRGRSLGARCPTRLRVPVPTGRDRRASERAERRNAVVPGAAGPCGATGGPGLPAPGRRRMPSPRQGLRGSLGIGDGGVPEGPALLAPGAAPEACVSTVADVSAPDAPLGAPAGISAPPARAGRRDRIRAGGCGPAPTGRGAEGLRGLAPPVSLRRAAPQAQEVCRGSVAARDVAKRVVPAPPRGWVWSIQSRSWCALAVAYQSSSSTSGCRSW